MLKEIIERTKKCSIVCGVLTLILLILHFVPYWSFEGETLSLGGYVWLDPSNPQFAQYVLHNTGAEANVNPIIFMSVFIILFGILGAGVSFWKPKNGYVTLVADIAALAGIVFFIASPMLRLSFMWIIQFIICIAIIVFSILAIVCENKVQKLSANNSSMSLVNAADRVAEIKSIGDNAVTVEGSKIIDLKGPDLSHLITYLTDPAPECRAAAAQVLGRTAADSAFTHMSHLINLETSEKVISAMRASLASIHENMAELHIQSK